MENTIKDQMQSFMAEWQKRLTQLQADFKAGNINVTEMYEKQKEAMLKNISDWKEHLDKATDIATEKATEMKAKLEELRVQLNLGTHEFTEKFEENRRILDIKMQEFQNLAKDAYENNYNQFMDYYDAGTKSFKSGLEVIQLQIDLAKKTGTEEVSKVKEELNTKINELQEKYTEMQKQFSENVEGWNKEMHKGMDQFREWLGNVIYRLK